MKSDFELMRETLLSFDPETRHHVIETMKLIRAMPRQEAVRLLADAAMRERLNRSPIALNCMP